MDFEKMSLAELKDYAKSIDLSFGNIGKEKLIEKIKEKDTENYTTDIDLPKTKLQETTNDSSNLNLKDSISLADSISKAIDDLDGSYKNIDTITEELPINTMICVKSITYGGLTYKSRINNAIHRWNQIGSEELMSVADLIEMNNYKRDFLNKPLVVLLDDRAIKYFRLTKVYENVAKINQLSQIFTSNNISLIESTIDLALNVSMRDILISKASHLIKNKVLVNINIIHLLSQKLKYDFEEIIEQNE